MKIVTRYDQLPIETRSFDWTATMDNYQPGDPVGKGQSEKDAIGDLLAQVDIKDYEALGLYSRHCMITARDRLTPKVVPISKRLVQAEASIARTSRSRLEHLQRRT